MHYNRSLYWDNFPTGWSYSQSCLQCLSYNWPGTWHRHILIHTIDLDRRLFSGSKVKNYDMWLSYKFSAIWCDYTYNYGWPLISRLISLDRIKHQAASNNQPSCMIIWNTGSSSFSCITFINKCVTRLIFICAIPWFYNVFFRSGYLSQTCI